MRAARPIVLCTANLRAPGRPPMSYANRSLPAARLGCFPLAPLLENTLASTVPLGCRDRAFRRPGFSRVLSAQGIQACTRDTEWRNH